MPYERQKNCPQGRGGARNKGGSSVWGAYIPAVKGSYPDPPIRGTVVDGKYGKEFRPAKGEPVPRGKFSAALRDWAVSVSYDQVVQIMREYADEAIRARQSEIARLERFIAEN